MVKVIYVSGNGAETAMVELDDFTVKTLYPDIAEMSRARQPTNHAPRRSSSFPGRRVNVGPGDPIASRPEGLSATDRPRAQRGARGMPKPTMAMMSRWISLVPPPKVKIV